MSSHNIGFYEKLTKNFFQLSSNVIKCAPFLFFWVEYLSKYYVICMFISNVEMVKHKMIDRFMF